MIKIFSGNKLRMNFIYCIFILIFIQFIVTSCADKKESAQSCSVQLDEQKFSKVSENTNCSNYERASAYLGNAGLSVDNFLQPGATDNITKTLNVVKLDSPTDYEKGGRGYITKALCLVGSSTVVNSDRCPNESLLANRSSGELELSLLAYFGDFYSLGFGVLDNDSNGDLTSSELSNFTKLQTSGVSTSGLGTGLSAYNNNFEVVIGDNHFIANSDQTKCDPYVDNYTDNASSNTTCAQRAIALGTSITEIRPIFKLDNMTDITGGGALNNMVSMVSELATISTSVESDLTALGMSSDNSFRKELISVLKRMDNGAKDNNPNADDNCSAVQLFDVMYLLVKNASDNSTSSSNLKSGNLISTTDLITAVDSSLSLLPSGASDLIKALPMSSARIVYKSNSSGYTDSYEKAESSLYQAIKNMRSLGIDDSIKEDGKVTFRELMCVAEN